jgi:hypothetical protein
VDSGEQLPLASPSPLRPGPRYPQELRMELPPAASPRAARWRRKFSGLAASYPGGSSTRSCSSAPRPSHVPPHATRWSFPASAACEDLKPESLVHLAVGGVEQLGHLCAHGPPALSALDLRLPTGFAQARLTRKTISSRSSWPMTCQRRPCSGDGQLWTARRGSCGHTGCFHRWLPQVRASAFHP